MLKKLFSHSFLYAIGPQVPRLVNVFILPIITAYLTPLDYGVYGTLLAYIGLLAGVKSLGFEVLLVNSFFKKTQWESYWKRYLGGLYLYNFLFSFIYVLILYFFIPKEAHENLWLLIFLIVTPAILFDTTKMVGSRYFQLKQKPRYIAMVTSVVGIVSIFINLYCIVVLKLGYLGWFISIAVGSMLTFCFYGYPLFIKGNIVPKITWNKNFWKKSLKIGLPTIPHKYSSYMLNSSDRLVMDQVKTPIEQIGIYNLAYIFGSYLDMVGTAIRMAIGPYFGKMYAKKTVEADKEVRYFIFFLQVSFIVGCTLLGLWVKQIFNVLINNQELESAYAIAIIIIMGYAYRPIYWAAMSRVFFNEKTNKLWRVSFIAGVLNVVLNFIFIPLYGIYAAAITTLISLIYLGISPYYIKEFKAMNTQKIYPVWWMVVVLVLTVILYFIRDSSIVYKGIISITLIVGYLIYFFKNKNKLNAIQI